jgi:hypothetical protein
MKRRQSDRPQQEQRDRAGGMEHDPARSGDKPGIGRSVERERGTIRPEEPPPQRRDRSDIIR